MENNKITSKRDCLIDRTDISPEDIAAWKEEDCCCDEEFPADREKCITYHCFDYDQEKLEQYYRQIYKGEFQPRWMAYWGLKEMFNDGWLKTPAYVDWYSLRSCIWPNAIKEFIHGIYNPQTRIDILNYIIPNLARYIGSDSAKENKLLYKELLAESKEALKIRKQELAKEKKAKGQSKKEKPEYVLTIDEIIQYAKEENPDAASVVRGMLRYFAFEKEGWSNSIIKNKIRSIDNQVIVHGDLVQGDKNVDTQIGNIEGAGIGVQNKQ